MSETSQCVRCGAPIDATDSVALSDGAACLACVDRAARTGARVLARQRYVRHAAGWSGLSVATFVASRWIDADGWPVVLGGVGALALVLAGVAFWRVSTLQAPERGGQGR